MAFIKTDKLPTWAGQILDQLKIDANAAPDEIFTKANQIANILAPNTRRLWKWILFAQGLAVLSPLLWLVVLEHYWTVHYAAYFVAFSILLFVIVSWWFRWRGMQHTWARARVIAEIARSKKITRILDSSITTEAIRSAPDLYTIGKYLDSGNSTASNYSLDKVKTQYLGDRIEDQLSYFERNLVEAQLKRKRLNKWVTVAIDTSLFLAVAGVVISNNYMAGDWLRWSGSNYILGILGVTLPLCAILIQLRATYLELNRRIGRYAQQINFLKPARTSLAAAANLEEAGGIMLGVERVLLAEVIDWFYQTEYSQSYYRGSAKDIGSREIEKLSSSHKRPARQRFLSQLGVGAAFFIRVLIGRLLVGIISIVLTVTFIAFRQKPESVELQSSLRQEDGRLLSYPAQKGSLTGWIPGREAANNGFILIAHGLHDRVEAQIPSDGDAHWITQLQSELLEQFDSNAPEICLVDWENAAKPYEERKGPAEAELINLLETLKISELIRTLKISRNEEMDIGTFLLDVAAIRPQAEAIGELVGYKLARAIRQGSIRRDRPMHFIGHSAGGFVVLHAAVVLEDLDLASEQIRLTMLDTPLPVEAHLKQVLQNHRIDYYCTSSFAVNVPGPNFHPNYKRIDITPPEGIDSFMGAHSYAHKWYVDSISNKNELGFSRSPLSPH